MNQYKKLLSYATAMINDKPQAELIVKAALEDSVEMGLDAEFNTKEIWEVAFRVIRNKCYDYLRLKQSLAESL